MTDIIHQSQAAKPRTRRAVVKGAAWSVPVIAAAVAAPAASASLLATITMTTPVAISTCGPYGDVVLAVTTDGTTAAAGTAVTVTLTAPMTFPSGQSTQVFITDSLGNVTISGLTAPATAGEYAITATALSVSTTGSVTATNSNVLISSGGGAFVPIAGVNDPVEVDSSNGVYLVLDADGVLSTTTGATVPLAPIPGLTGITSFSAYAYGGTYVTAVGPDGVAYASVNGSAFTPIVGSSTIQEVETAYGYVYGLDAAGIMYRSASWGQPWVQIPSPVPFVAMTSFDAYAGDGNFVTALGSDGIAYRSFAGGIFTAIPGSTSITQVELGGFYSVGIDASGQVLRAYYASGAWTPIALPLGVTALDVEVYEPDARWVIVQGSDGIAYQSFDGAAFAPISGSTTIEEVSVGLGFWVGKDAAGVIYRASTPGGAWVPITGLAGAEDFSVSELNGGAIVAIGPSQMTC